MDEDANTYRRKKLVEVFDWHGDKSDDLVMKGMTWRWIDSKCRIGRLLSFNCLLLSGLCNFECIS